MTDLSESASSLAARCCLLNLLQKKTSSFTTKAPLVAENIPFKCNTKTCVTERLFYSNVSVCSVHPILVFSSVNIYIHHLILFSFFAVYMTMYDRFVQKNTCILEYSSPMVNRWNRSYLQIEHCNVHKTKLTV